KAPPPVGKLSILQHLVASYKLWHEYMPHIPKTSRYTLGEKIDACFIETLELLFFAQYAKKEQRLPTLQKANVKFDSLKFFLQLLWETNGISAKQYANISKHLVDIGKMLGGWLRRVEAETAQGLKAHTQSSARTKE
ncbi:MAG: four helix bundle protein, partial [Patescibacteria group bacterium]